MNKHLEGMEQFHYLGMKETTITDRRIFQYEKDY